MLDVPFLSNQGTNFATDFCYLKYIHSVLNTSVCTQMWVRKKNMLSLGVPASPLNVTSP